MPRKENILLSARKGVALPVVCAVARSEGFQEQELLSLIAQGLVVIPVNKIRDISKPCGIGSGLRTKVNVNLGTSPDRADLDMEKRKLRLAVDLGADAVMDLSTGGDIDGIRRELLAECPVPFGTVPVYQAAARKDGKIELLTADDMFRAVESHMESGVDFVTVHCGITKNTVELLRSSSRVTGIVSRGGALTAEWITRTGRENPLYQDFSRLVEMAKKHDVTLSLGDGLRPGSILDATDAPQVGELIELARLAQYAAAEGVQVMIEGPGHVPLNEVEANIKLQKAVCKGIPFYVLGPLVTDVGSGYDHITAAIGGAIAAAAGADFLCYVTPAEHLGLPDEQDLREGLAASRIAAHAADIAKGVKGATDWDMRMSKARLRRDWKEQISLSVDPQNAQKIHDRFKSSNPDACSMCGSFCSMKFSESLIDAAAKGEGSKQ